MTDKPKSPLTAVWNGMSDLARRIIALEKSRAIRIGPPHALAEPPAMAVRDIWIGKELVQVLVPADDKRD